MSVIKRCLLTTGGKYDGQFSTFTSLMEKFPSINNVRGREDRMGLVPSREDIEKMPISKEDLKALFDYLDRPNPDPCTHTFKETESFLRQRDLDKTKIIPWLQENGAGCDCEVIFNVDETWGEIVGREYLNEDESDLYEATQKPWWKLW